MSNNSLLAQHAQPMAAASDASGVGPREISVGDYRLSVYNDLESVEGLWRAFETAAVATGYQQFDVVAAWFDTIGKAHNIQPVIVVCRSINHEPVLLWPLALERGAGIFTLSFAGGSHTNYGMGLYAPDHIGQLTKPVLIELIKKLRAAVPQADGLFLENQPLRCAGQLNPLALLPHDQAANPSYFTALPDNLEAFLSARRSAKSRKRLRWQQRKLEEIAPLRFAKADSEASVDAVIAAFSEQKAARFLETGTKNIFAAADVQAFLKACAHRSLKASGALELFALWCGDKIIATYGGVSHGGRFSIWLNSYALDATYARHSPAEVLLVHLVGQLIERGHDSFDLGTGDASYKHQWLDQREDLFTSFLPLTAKGARVFHVWHGFYRIKRFVKQTPALWAMVVRLRQIRAAIGLQ